MRPAIRANQTKLCIRRIKVLEPSQREPILDSIRHLRPIIRQASVLEWLPIEIHVGLADAIARHLPGKQAAAFWRDFVLEAFERPLLKAIVFGALRIYGNNPLGLARFAPQSWTISMRDCGEVRPTLEPGRAVMRFVGLPPVLRDSPGQRYYWEGGLSTIYTYFGKTGHVARALSEESSNEPEYIVTWNT